MSGNSHAASFHISKDFLLEKIKKAKSDFSEMALYQHLF